MTRTLTVADAACRLLSVERPLVLTHRTPDGDTVGTAMALLAFYRAIGREGAYASEEPLPERLAFLAEGYERALPPYDGYTPVAVDVASRAQLGALAERIDPTAVVLSIDHHAVGEPFSPLYCLPEAASAAEVLYTVLSHLEERGVFTMNGAIAAPLYAAICSDTGSFRFSNTTAATHTVAARLLTYPFDHADICHRLFVEKSESQLRAEGFTAARLCASGDISYAVIDRASYLADGLCHADFDTAIDIVRARRATAVAFVVKEQDADVCKVSMRSTSRDVSRIAARFGGGGHVRAAGCTLLGSPEAVKEDILRALREDEPC